MAVSLGHENRSEFRGPAAASPDCDQIIDARRVRATHADAVDIEECFFRAERSRNCARKSCSPCSFPVEAGGEAARVSHVALICYALGRVCSSTAMISAMHQANVACIVQHARRHAEIFELSAPYWPRADVGRVIDDRRKQWRECAHERIGDPNRRERNFADPQLLGSLLWSGRRDDRFDRAAGPSHRNHQVLVLFLKA